MIPKNLFIDLLIENFLITNDRKLSVSKMCLSFLLFSFEAIDKLLLNELKNLFICLLAERKNCGNEVQIYIFLN